uniref:Uncharacterized protein n=1 Tax=Anguilla anguilla TaxID=7936 RepID=A0A0E9Q4G9_ANGAN
MAAALEELFPLAGSRSPGIFGFLAINGEVKDKK